MTSENAPDAMNITNKRVRFEAPTSALHGSPSTLSQVTNQSPKGCALSSIRNFVVTLRHYLSPIVQQAAESHTDLLHKLMTKTAQHKKMEDENDFIPRSARLINFDFRVTKKVENSPEFLAIKTETDTLVLEFKMNLKQKIMDTLRIECMMLRTELYEHLATKLHYVVTAQLLTRQSQYDPHKIISTIIHYYFEELFGVTDLTIEELIKIYKKIHGLTTFPIPQDNEIPPMEVDGDIDPQDPPNDAQQAAIKLRDACQPAKQIILGAFTRTYSAYFDRAEAILIDASLKKLATSNTLEEATEATRERLDVEDSVDAELLDSIVNEKVKAKTNKLSAEVGQLKRQMNLLTKNKNTSNSPKGKVNNRRGQTTTTGASTNKKKSKTRSKTSIVTHTTPKANAQQAAAPARGTRRNTDGNSKKKGTKKKAAHRRK